MWQALDDWDVCDSPTAADDEQQQEQYHHHRLHRHPPRHRSTRRPPPLPCHRTDPLSCDDFIAHIQSCAFYEDQIVHEEHIRPRPAKFADSKSEVAIPNELKR